MHRVLVVDDDKVLQESVRQALQFHHFGVDVADNGRQAVSAVYREKYDLVVMDVNMPEMDGIEALKKIKASDPSASVIMCSAMGQQAMVIEAIQSGAKDFIVKPFQADRVIESIRKVLG